MLSDPWDDPAQLQENVSNSTWENVEEQSNDTAFFEPEPKPRRAKKKDRRRKQELSVDKLTNRSQKDNKSDVRLSKALTAVLRHNKMGFKVGSDGYLKVDDILQHPHFARTLQVTKEDIVRVVDSNDKQRFTISTDNKGDDIIRANQGHSVEVSDLHMEEIRDATLYPSVVHGTYRTALPLIRKDGLHRMKRNHIHLTTARPTDSESVISGMRKSCNAFVYIDIKSAIVDGIRFYLSSNQVILCEGDVNGYLPPKYFQRIDVT